LIKTIVNFARMAMVHPNLRELDINPLIATPEGCWAVDARVIWQKSSDRVK
jgi:succinyl-CoA synthetase beta subunit